MKTTVVNVHIADLRARGYKDLKAWMADKDNIYIARHGVIFLNGERFPKHSSVWACPFKPTKTGDRKKMLVDYERYITQKINAGEVDLKELRGHRLGCWCVSEDVTTVRRNPVCHGEVLLKLLAKHKSA